MQCVFRAETPNGNQQVQINGNRGHLAHCYFYDVYINFYNCYHALVENIYMSPYDKALYFRQGRESIVRSVDIGEPTVGNTSQGLIYMGEFLQTHVILENIIVDADLSDTYGVVITNQEHNTITFNHVNVNIQVQEDSPRPGHVTRPSRFLHKGLYLREYCDQLV